MYTHNFAPFLDVRPGVPEDQRFKALTRNYGLSFRDKREDIMGLFAFVSADGYHWRKLSNAPLITKGLFDSQNVSFWSEHEECYVCYLREAAGDGEYSHSVRSIARCCSDNFQDWTEPELMDMGGTPPEHLYTNQTQPYFRASHIYIALPGRFMPDRQVLSDEEGEALSILDGKWRDCSDAVLLTSRGGSRYDRTFMESFVRPGLDRRNWTSRCNYPACGIVQTGTDEMSIYVERHNMQAGKYLERLTLRLDGFASLSAGYSGGVMITKPLMFSGERLTLNYATSAAGHIRVDLQDQSGKAIVGHTLQDCSFIVGDEIEHTVTWNGNADISHLSGQPVRFRFELKDADIYSFQVQNTNAAEPSVPGDD